MYIGARARLAQEEPSNSGIIPSDGGRNIFPEVPQSLVGSRTLRDGCAAIEERAWRERLLCATLKPWCTVLSREYKTVRSVMVTGTIDLETESGVAQPITNSHCHDVPLYLCFILQS